MLKGICNSLVYPFMERLSLYHALCEYKVSASVLCVTGSFWVQVEAPISFNDREKSSIKWHVLLPTYTVAPRHVFIVL